jgi:hypothetical protein
VVDPAWINTIFRTEPFNTGLEHLLSEESKTTARALNILGFEFCMAPHVATFKPDGYNVYVSMVTERHVVRVYEFGNSVPIFTGEPFYRRGDSLDDAVREAAVFVYNQKMKEIEG